MRTVVLFGLLLIGMAINPDLDIPDNILSFGGFLMLASLFMDVSEYLHNHNRK